MKSDHLWIQMWLVKYIWSWPHIERDFEASPLDGVCFYSILRASILALAATKSCPIQWKQLLVEKWGAWKERIQTQIACFPISFMHVFDLEVELNFQASGQLFEACCVHTAGAFCLFFFFCSSFLGDWTFRLDCSRWLDNSSGLFDSSIFFETDGGFYGDCSIFIGQQEYILVQILFLKFSRGLVLFGLKACSSSTPLWSDVRRFV